MDDDKCSRGHTTPADILFSPKTTALCVGCGEPIGAERLAVVSDATKCATCQSGNDEEEFYVMESAATGSEGKTSRVPVRMSRSEYKKIKRPGYGSNLRFDRK